MKYMGSKRSMLRNGLGDLILQQARSCARVVDLFCGSGAVAWFAAEETECPVTAVDLQEYAALLARAVIARTERLDSASIWEKWFRRAEALRADSRYWGCAVTLDKDLETSELVRRARMLCTKPSHLGPVWNAYGGYYFSPSQALAFDALRATLPKHKDERTACLAAELWAASRCAAAPGHTAQPFSPNKRAAPFIRAAWTRDPFELCREALGEIAVRHAQKKGQAIVADAVSYTELLGPGDLVFVDPPYSEAQYSRFYHVLETITRGKCGPVEGAGRYPPIDERPQSRFCRKSQSLAALEDLLRSLAGRDARVILTFPEGECSSGVSGQAVLSVARSCFRVRKQVVTGTFSTLGGNNGNRLARKPSSELLLLMQPK